MKMGSTPTHTFTVPYEASSIRKIRVSYGQNGKELVCKSESDCVLEEGILSCTLTQRDTLQFDHRKPLEIQVKILLNTGDVFLSDLIICDVEYALCREIL